MQRIKTKHIKHIIGLTNYYSLMGLPFDADPISPANISTEVDFNKLSNTLQEIIMSLPLLNLLVDSITVVLIVSNNFIF